MCIPEGFAGRQINDGILILIAPSGALEGLAGRDLFDRNFAVVNEPVDMGNGRRLLLRVDCTNDIVGGLLVIVYGLLGRLRCRYVLPRYDLTELARAVALAHGLRCCSSMSG